LFFKTIILKNEYIVAILVLVQAQYYQDRVGLVINPTVINEEIFFLYLGFYYLLRVLLYYILPDEQVPEFQMVVSS